MSEITAHGAPPPAEPRPPATQSDCTDALLARADALAGTLAAHHNAVTTMSPPRHASHWFYQHWLIDPVRLKNLEKARSLIEAIGLQLRKPASGQDGDARASACRCIDQLNRDIEKAGGVAALSSSEVWEMADQLEVELIGVCDAVDLALRLLSTPEQDLSSIPCARIKQLRRSAERRLAGDRLVESDAEAMRHILQHVQLAKIASYRRDRALIVQRGRFLIAAAFLLAVFTVFFAWVYEVAPDECQTPGASTAGTCTAALVATMIAGAIGAMLGRAIRVRGDAEGNSHVPLGIRSLMSFSSVLLPQGVIGAVSALVFFLVYTSGMIQITGLDITLTSLALLGFVAGFSEAAFLGVIDRVANALGQPETARQDENA